MKEKSYFGLSVYSDNEKYILESDIKKDKKSFVFLFDMNKLFERFVGKMIKKLCTF
jgi:5-methylcytosine-specific restriction endonuclease McrBC regulatory subunit McrC